MVQFALSSCSNNTIDEGGVELCCKVFLANTVQVDLQLLSI